MNTLPMLVTSVSLVIAFTVCYVYLLTVNRQRKIYSDIFTNNTSLVKGLIDLNKTCDLNKQKLTDLQHQYNMLLISKLKLIISYNPDTYKTILGIELKKVIESDGASNLLGVVRVLMSDVNGQFKAISDILEEQEALT